MYIDKHPGILYANIHQEINLWKPQSGVRINRWTLGLFRILARFSVVEREREHVKWTARKPFSVFTILPPLYSG